MSENQHHDLDDDEVDDLTPGLPVARVATGSRRPEGAPIDGILDGAKYSFRVGLMEGRYRLDLYLHRVFRGRSRAYWKRMISRGAVEVDGHLTKGARKVGQGEKIAVHIDGLGKGPAPRVAEPSYTIIYEDDWLVAVNKRAGAFVHPVGRLHNRSVVNDLRDDRPQDGHELRPCHRLDRFVSGLLVFARGKEAAGRLGQQFEERNLKKAYLALVAGVVPDDSGIIDLPIGNDPSSVIRIKMGVDHGEGKPSRTFYQVRERFADHTLVELEPKTGRRHQLRIHMAELGHPIVNDPLYGPEIDVAYFERQTFDNHDDPQDARRWMALHSHRLTFAHPGLGQQITLAAPLAGAMLELVDSLRP